MISDARNASGNLINAQTGKPSDEIFFNQWKLAQTIIKCCKYILSDVDTASQVCK